MWCESCTVTVNHVPAHIWSVLLLDFAGVYGPQEVVGSGVTVWQRKYMYIDWAFWHVLDQHTVTVATRHGPWHTYSWAKVLKATLWDNWNCRGEAKFIPPLFSDTSGLPWARNTIWNFTHVASELHRFVSLVPGPLSGEDGEGGNLGPGQVL